VKRYRPSRADGPQYQAAAILLEQNDEWAVQRSRYMTLETIAPIQDDPIIGLPAMAE